MIWVIGGTGDARLFIEKLLISGISLVVTTATEAGARLLGNLKGLTVKWGRFTGEEMGSFIQKQHISLVIDMSHPYAEQVSQNAIRACKKADISYVRFERPGTAGLQPAFCGSYGEIAGYLQKKEGNVLLTIGTNNLSSFSELDRDRLFVRVLPVDSSLKKCRENNISLSHIIAVQGPFSTVFNKALLEEYNILYLVTKDSGESGGVPEKNKAASVLGVELLLVERPRVEYPLVFSEIQDVFSYVKNISFSEAQ